MVNETPTTTNPTQPAGWPFQILITDDDTGTRATLSGLLAEQGFRIIQAGSGEEAIEIVQYERIHLVFFDMHMPRMTGLEALQQVRLMNDLLPAILMTADATRDVIRQAQLAQVFSVIPKPVNKNIVLHTLMRALQQVYGVAQQSPQPPASPTTPVGEGS
jgi:two-component system, response regulator PdtaR